MKTPCTFSVKAKVLRVGLRDQNDVEALFDEVPYWPSVAFGVARCETLVGGVEERDVMLGLHDLSYFLPLLGAEIRSSRIVSTDM